MITIQNQIVDADDPRSDYLMDGKDMLILWPFYFPFFLKPWLFLAWSNVCQSLGAAFEPFLQYVVPNLLKTASYKPSDCK